MAMYKISLLGLYTYDNTLFDQLTIPAMLPPVVSDEPYHYYIPDKQTLVNLILEKAADFPALYPDCDFMKFMCGVWSKNCEYMMTVLWETMNARFNPIENYDRHSKITRKANSSAGGTVTGSQTAFNADTFKDTGKSVSSQTSSGGETVEDHTHGNIGVRSGQELVAQSREMALFKWYDIVSDDFISKFCVQIF